MTGSINLIIEYGFPYDAVLKDIEEYFTQDSPMKQELLQRLEDVKGKTMRIIELLPVEAFDLKKSSINRK